MPTETAHEDPYLRAALAELDAAPTRSYFDEAADAAARTSFYQQIDPGASGADLYRALSGLVTTTHGNKPSYRPAVWVYPWLDLHEDLRLRGVYSGKELDPQQLIQEDFQIERQRVARLRERSLAEALTPKQLARELDMIEAELLFNCEHVVCQSWFAKHEPMRGDVHHLFACEPNCNSFRGNIPYFDFGPARQDVRADCGRRERMKFEPSGGRGAVARATLYFLLRYPRLIVQDALAGDGFTGDLRLLLAERVATLLAWHADEPVSTYERHRNAAAFELQQNRNPLIDLPEVAAKADFGLAFAH